VVPFLVQGKVLNTCGMTVEVTQSMSCEWIPHDDVSLLTTTCHKSMD